MQNRYEVIVFTGSRSEYGLLSPIVDALHCDQIGLKIVVAGDHHEIERGYSRGEIEGAGIAVVDLPYSQNCTNNNKKIAYLIDRLDLLFEETKPVLLVIYGDRYETFAAAISAHQSNVKILHLEGGDITEGGLQDDSVRHAISKLATFHLTSNAESARNLIQMGEEPWRVKVLGLSTSSYIAEQNYSNEMTVNMKYELDERAIILFTIHPLPGSQADTDNLARESIKALLSLDSSQYRIIITYPNSDPFGERIIEAYRSVRKNNVSIFASLGRRDYHGILALNLAKPGRVVCAGNSSSGIKEAGFFKCVAVNIGDRQKSRLKSGVVIDCPVDASTIETAIRQASEPTTAGFDLEGSTNPYQSEIGSKDIRDLIINYANDQKSLVKRHLISETQL